MSTHRMDGDAQPVFRPLESIAILGIVGILALALGLFALTRPAKIVNQQKLSYTESGTFDYSATAPAGSIYGAKGLVTGEPIITKLVGPVRVGFDYRLSADVPSDVRGTAALDVRVDLGQGLSRTFPVATTQSFTGSRVAVSGALPLTAITSYIDAANHDLGSASSDVATVTVQPQIKVSGIVGGRALGQTNYAPTLPLTFTGSSLALAGSTSGNGSDTASTSPLTPSSSGSIGYDAPAPNTVSLVFLHPAVTASRIIGFGLAALCLLLCLWFARPLRSGRSVADRDRINAMYGSQLIPVTGIAPHDGPIVDVAGIESLAELAKKYESMIMRLAERDADVYLVWDNGILYRYRALYETPTTDSVSKGSDHTELDSTQVLPKLPVDYDDLALDVEQLLLGDVGGVLMTSREQRDIVASPSI